MLSTFDNVNKPSQHVLQHVWFPSTFAVILATSFKHLAFVPLEEVTSLILHRESDVIILTLILPFII